MRGPALLWLARYCLRTWGLSIQIARSSPLRVLPVIGPGNALAPSCLVVSLSIASAAIKSGLHENIKPAHNNNTVGPLTLGRPGKLRPFNSLTDSDPFITDVYFMQLWTCVAQQQQRQHHCLTTPTSVFIGQPQPQPQASALATENIERVVSPAPRNATEWPSLHTAKLGLTGTVRGGLGRARGRVSGDDAIRCNGISFDGGTMHHRAGVDVEDDRHRASIDDKDNYHRPGVDNQDAWHNGSSHEGDHNGGGASDGCGDEGGGREGDDDEIM
ncbi:hypothetical protein EDB85DRAFT_1896812 [Lactarius pseudohatsudake]|nr:hypothetical protein EDB85DRAFT_1896812 [Lactarius pseudohatsudake]